MSKVVYSQRWEWQTRLPFPSLTVYKIKKNLENVPRNLDDLKYRGTGAKHPRHDQKRTQQNNKINLFVDIYPCLHAKK